MLVLHIANFSDNFYPRAKFSEKIKIISDRTYVARTCFGRTKIPDRSQKFFRENTFQRHVHMMVL